MGLILFPLLSLLTADPLRLNAGVSAEVRAGESPILANEDTSDFAAALVTPRLDLEVRGHQVDLALAYFPRFVWQTPNALDRTFRPLLLHQATLSLAARPSRTTELTAHGYGSYGEPDYLILSQILSSSQGMLPQGGGASAVPVVVGVTSLSADVGLRSDVSRRVRFLADANLTYIRPQLASPAQSQMMMTQMMMTSAVPTPTALTSTSRTGVLGAGYRVTPVDELGVGVSATYATYSDEVNLFVINPALWWRGRRSQSTELRLTLGLGESRAFGPSMAFPHGEVVSLSPTGSVEGSWHTRVGEDDGLVATFKLAVDQFVDPVLGIAYPRGLVAGQLLFVFTADWSAGLQGDFAASLSAPPAATPGIPANIDETVFSVALPIRHRASRQLMVEFGGRWSERAPNFEAADFSFHARQLWAYVTLTASTIDTPPWPAR